MKTGFLIVILAVLGVAHAPWPAGRAGAEEPVPLLEVRVADSANGEPLDGVRAALVDASSGRVYARFDSTRYFGPRRPRAGDRLFAYARGYGVASHVLDEAERVVAFALEGAGQSATVRLVAPAEEFRQPPGTFRARFALATTGNWPAPETPDLQRGGRSPIEDRWEQPLLGTPLLVRWGAGSYVRVSVEAGDRIVWPLYEYLRAGQEAVFHLEGGRMVPVVRPARGGPRLRELEVVVDQLWQPDVDPLRVDAWRWHLNGPDWFEEKLRGRGPRLSHTPEVPFHVLALIDDQALQLHVDSGTPRIDLSRPGRMGILAERPLVDGEPAPGGSLIAAGRLDRLTICEFEALQRRVPGFVHELPPPNEAWSPLRLPVNEWLTVFDRARGLAHLRWGAQTPPSGSFAAGRLIVRAPVGYRATGSVMVFPVWKGAGTVGTSPPRARRLRHDWPADGELVVRGLVGGTYGLDVDLEYVHEKTGRRIRAPRFASVDVAGTPAVGELRLALPRR